ncbi:MAG TPA: site-2 protease family protein [Candidatus Paceibacterota bacterium]
MRNSNLGFLVLLGKLGPKLVPVLAKMGDSLWQVVKPLFGLKSAGLAGSVGLYTYLFTWEMAISLVVFIGIHEYGHLWAMKRCGIKTKGMFFLPGFGAVAVAEERFGSARNEAYIAIMGPIFGLVFFVFPIMYLFWYTGNPQWAAVAAIMAFINLINLLPINPLDGGRILKSLAYSEKLAASLWITVIVSLVTATLGFLAGFSLLGIMAIIGFWELAVEFGIRERISHFLMSLVRGVLYVSIAFCVPYFLDQVGAYWADKADADKVGIMWVLLVGTFALSLVAATMFDAYSETIGRGLSIIRYPLEVLKTLWVGVWQIVSLRRDDIQPIENYDRMNTGGKLWYAASFLVLTTVHIFVIFRLGHVPGADLAKQLME